MNGLNACWYQGWSISLTPDGNMVAVGAPMPQFDAKGYVRVHYWTGTGWAQRGPDIESEVNKDRLGWSVSLSDDGATLAAGAPLNNGNGVASGHVRIYEWNGSVWTQKGSDIDGAAANDQFGTSVSLSSIGNTVAVGAPLNDGAGSNGGHVRVCDWDGFAWNSRGADIKGAAANDQSGTSVSLSSIGNTVAIGAPLNDGNGADSGHVRIYEWNGSVWTQKGSDIDGDAAGDNAGRSVSLNSGGTVLAIGAPLSGFAVANGGQVRVFFWSGSSWIQRGSDIDEEPVGDQTGHSVAISANGYTVAMGSPNNSGNAPARYNSGRVVVYAFPQP